MYFAYIKGFPVYTNIKSKLTNYSLVRATIYITIVTLYGCGGDSNSGAVENVESVAAPSVPTPPPITPPAPIDETLVFIGSWLSNCGERNNSAYYTNELILTSDSLEIIQHKYDSSDCVGVPVESVSQTNKPYTYPESNSDTNDKFIVVEVFNEPTWKMTVYVETYDNLLYISNNLLITHEGFAFDSSQTSDINYVNYLTKQE
jgi:hypothetical protein